MKLLNLFFIITELIIIGLCLGLSSPMIENFKEPDDDLYTFERQKRKGEPSLLDKLKLKDIPFTSRSNIAPDFRRFKIELFSEKNFQKRITFLKDDPDQFKSARINAPIKSIRIQIVPNDHWRFAQFFNFVIYLNHDPSMRIVFHSPPDERAVFYEIPDTTKSSELLEWMANYDTKIIYYMTNIYEPIPDLYSETFFKRRLLVPPDSTLTDRQLENDPFPVNPLLPRATTS